MDEQSAMRARWPLTLTAIGTLYFLLTIRMLGRWWFQDDPGQFLAMRKLEDPTRIFLDLTAVRRFGSGQGLVPMQMLDYWVDAHLGTPLPLTGYVHSLLVSLLALLGVFFALCRVTADRKIAFAGSLVWLLLPSTAATCLYLSTRHYVEGLALSCVVFCLASSPSPLRIKGWATLLGCATAAMLSKETYAGLVPAMLLAFGVRLRSKPRIAVALSLGAAYALYRIATVGAGMKYAMPLLGPGGYLKYLVTSPFLFSGSLLAYPVLLAAAWASVRYWREGGDGSRRDTAVFAVLLLAAMFMLYPVAYAVVNTYRQPGTWYRAPFLPNTLALGWICLLVSRLVPSPRRLALIGGLGVTLLPGLFLGLRWWGENMDRERSEARFVLEHPSRLLFTDDPCWYYLRDVQSLCGQSPIRILQAEKPDLPKDIAAVRAFREVWSYQDGEVKPDPARATAYLRGVTPAFRGHSPETPR